MADVGNKAPRFNDLNTAARLRQVISKIARDTVREVFPAERRGTVVAVDTARGVAYVKYPDEDASFPVKAGAMMPDPTAIVRVGGPIGARRIEEIISGPVRFTGSVNITGAVGTEGPQGLPGEDGKTILNGLVAPTNDIGVDGDFYIDTVAWFIYGPKLAGAWPAGVSIIGPQGATGPEGPAGSAGSSNIKCYKVTTAHTDTNGTYNDVVGWDAIPVEAGAEYRVFSLVRTSIDTDTTACAQLRFQSSGTTLTGRSKIRQPNGGHPGSDAEYVQDSSIGTTMGAQPGTSPGAGVQHDIELSASFTTSTAGTLIVQARLSDGAGGGQLNITTASRLWIEKVTTEN